MPVPWFCPKFCLCPGFDIVRTEVLVGAGAKIGVLVSPPVGFEFPGASVTVGRADGGRVWGKFEQPTEAKTIPKAAPAC